MSPVVSVCAPPLPLSIHPSIHPGSQVPAARGWWCGHSWLALLGVLFSGCTDFTRALILSPSRCLCGHEGSFLSSMGRWGSGSSLFPAPAGCLALTCVLRPLSAASALEGCPGRAPWSHVPLSSVPPATTWVPALICCQGRGTGTTLPWQLPSSWGDRGS